MTITQGSSITINYTMTIDDTTFDKSTMSFIVGQKKIIPYVEQQLVGMNSGDSKKIEVLPQNGFGEVDTRCYKEYPRSQFPADIPPKVGNTLQLRGGDGSEITAVIREIQDEIVILDINHPLAGKTLYFDVTITEVN